ALALPAPYDLEVKVNMVAEINKQYLPSPGNRYRIGMWVAMASILMLFTALSSAYIVRAASANDWQPLRMPRVLLLSTALIILSSVALEFARRKLKSGEHGAHKGLL